MFGYYFIHHSVIVYAMGTAPAAWTAYEAHALRRYREQRGADCYVPPNAAEAYFCQPIGDAADQVHHRTLFALWFDAVLRGKIVLHLISDQPGPRQASPLKDPNVLARAEEQRDWRDNWLSLRDGGTYRRVGIVEIVGDKGHSPYAAHFPNAPPTCHRRRRTPLAPRQRGPAPSVRPLVEQSMRGDLAANTITREALQALRDKELPAKYGAKLGRGGKDASVTICREARDAVLKV